MNGVLAAFVVIDLPRPITIHAKADTKPNKSTLELQVLLQSRCRLISATRVGKRFQLLLKFESLQECVFAVGGFARSQKLGKSSSQILRIGISIGEVPEGEVNLDFPAHSKAKWLTGITSQASILVSEGTAFVGHELKLLPYGFEDYGEFFDVNAGQMSRVFSLVHPQLPLLKKVEDDRPKHNIPWPTDFFIGREPDIESVGGMLEHLRYVRLIGPSGVGKSTLARRLGLELVDEYRDGVKYVDLSKVVDKAGLLVQLFRSIKFPIDQSGEVNLELARKHFGGKHHLLILDGCEEIEGHIEQFANALLKSDRVQILATSIQSSQTLHGVEYLVEDLPVPAIDDIACIKDIEGVDACALFIDGMRKFRQGVPPQDSEAINIFRLCRLTAGNPLALNLAARRLKFESLQSIIDGYTEQPDAPHIHGSVTRTLCHLTSSSRETIEHASSFAGKWSRSQLATLMDRKPSSLYEDLHILQILGLIREERDLNGRGRFVLSGHFRHGIRSILRQESRLDTIREKHLLMILDLCRTAIQGLNGPDQRRHLDFLNSVTEDLESALQFLIESKPSVDEFIEAMRSTWPYWFKRNRLRAVLTLADQALARFGSEDLTGAARLKMLKSIFLVKDGQTETAISLLDEALATANPDKEPILFCQLHVNLGIALWADDRPREAIKAYSIALKKAEKLDHKSLLISSTTGLCSAYISVRDVDSAAKWHKRFRDIAGDSPDLLDRWNLIMGEIQLAWSTDNYSRASELIQTCMDIAKMGGDSALISRTYLWKAQVEASCGQMENAATSLGSCVSVMNSDEHNFHKANKRRMTEIEKAIAAQLGDQSLNQFKFVGNLDALNWL